MSFQIWDHWFRWMFSLAIEILQMIEWKISKLSHNISFKGINIIKYSRKLIGAEYEKGFGNGLSNMKLLPS